MTVTTAIDDVRESGRPVTESTAGEVQQTGTLDDWLFRTFCLCLLGAAILPLLPIWMGAITVVATVFVVANARRGIERTTLAVLLVGAHGVYLFGWLAALVASPPALFVDSLVNYLGLPLGVVPNTAQLFGHALLVAALAVLAWRRTAPLLRLFVIAATAFAAWALISTAVNAIDFGNESALILAAGPVWIGWSVAALLTVLLVRSDFTHNLLINMLVAAGALLAVAILLQFLTADYSYVLVTAGSDSVFGRVRASYYYHAPATQFVAFVTPIVLVLALLKRQSVFILFLLVVMVFALALNSTRGLSLAGSAGLATALAFLVFRGRAFNFAGLVGLLAVGILGTSIMYAKPGSAVNSDQLPQAVEAEGLPQSADGQDGMSGQVTTLQEAVPTDLATVNTTNSFRRDLAVIGLQTARQRPIVGYGPGNGRIVLPQNRSNQQRYEVSSHVLAIDLAAMGGLPALAFLAAMFVIAGIAGLSSVFGPLGSQRHGLIQLGSLGALGVFALASFFHPQERSHVVLIAVVLAAAIVACRAPERRKVGGGGLVAKRAMVGGSAVLGLGLGGWIVATSPSYVFPAIEFTARHASELRDGDLSVYATNRLLGHALGAAFRIAGVDGTPQLLEDDPDRLPDREAFVLWAPADERHYPELRESLGPAINRRFGQWMSVELPRNWSLLDSFQPTVQFLRAGAFSNIKVIARTAAFGGGTGDGRAELDMSSNELAVAQDIALHLSGDSPGQAEVSWTTDNGTPGSAQVPFGSAVRIENAASDSLTVRVDDASGAGIATLTYMLRAMPSIAHFGDVRARYGHDDFFRPAPAVNDLSDQSAIALRAIEQTVVEFEFADPFLLSAYRLLPQIDGPRELPMPLNWSVEGEGPDGTVLLDRRSLSAHPVEGAGFAIEVPSEVKLIRFVFPGTPGQNLRTLHVREIGIYPAENP